MKKFQLLAMAILVAMSVSAQKKYAPKRTKVKAKTANILITPKLGVNFSDLTSVDNTKVKIGLVAGVEGLYMVKPKFGVSAGRLYSDQGSSLDVSSGSSDLNLAYINLPVLANFYVADGLALKVGLQPGYLLSANAKVSGGGTNSDTDVKDNFETLDISIPLGMSYEFNNFVIEGRYNLGLTKIPKGSNTKDSKNSVIQVTIGYRFNTK